MRGLHQALASHLLPKSAQVHRHIKDFLAQEIAGIFETSQILKESTAKTTLFTRRCGVKWDQYNKAVTELLTKKNKDGKSIEGGSGYYCLNEDI